MRFISPHARLRVIVKHQKVEVLASGSPRVIGPGFTAEFREHDVRPWEEQYARENLSFRGTVTDTAERPIDPIPSRVGSFDTSQIDDPELRKEVEERMLAHSSHGRDFYMVPKPIVPMPWPTYDKTKGGGRGRTTPVAIAEMVHELGLDPADVIAYERDNQNREDVIGALEALTVSPTEEEELIIA